MDLQVFNATLKELNKHKHPIFIGISVGVKPMSEQMALSYMHWAGEHSAGPIQILIADKIAQFNYLALSHYTKQGSLARAIRDGERYQSFFNSIFAKFTKSNRDRFNIIKWEDIESPRFFNYLKRIQQEFESNPAFKKIVLSYAEKYIKRRNKVLSDEKKVLLCQYILHELAVLLDGIRVDDKNYRLIVYPTYQYSGMSELVSQIQSGKQFSLLKKELSLQKTIMVEFIINEETDDLKMLDNRSMCEL